jgi:hypothetical protein
MILFCDACLSVPVINCGSAVGEEVFVYVDIETTEDCTGARTFPAHSGVPGRGSTVTASLCGMSPRRFSRFPLLPLVC